MKTISAPNKAQYLRMLLLACQHVMVMYAGAVAIPLVLGAALGLSKTDIAFLINADLLVAGAPYVVSVLTVLGRAGIRVPDGMSVVSRDHEPYLDYLVPELTRYRVLPAQFSRRLSRAVLALAQGGSVPLRSRLLLPQFVPGGTLGHVS